MLLEQKQPAAALKDIRGLAGPRTQPLPRLRGSATAAEAAADRQKAAEYYAKLSSLRRMPTATGPSSRARRHTSRSDEVAAVLLVAWVLARARRPPTPTPWRPIPTSPRADADYAAGKKAIEKQELGGGDRAAAKSRVRHPDNADLQNYLGYAHRNLKQFDPAFKHYKRAIELDARHRGAHEYIGEAI